MISHWDLQFLLDYFFLMKPESLSLCPHVSSHVSQLIATPGNERDDKEHDITHGCLLSTLTVLACSASHHVRRGYRCSISSIITKEKAEAKRVIRCKVLPTLTQSLNLYTPAFLFFFIMDNGLFFTLLCLSEMSTNNTSSNYIMITT